MWILAAGCILAGYAPLTNENHHTDIFIIITCCGGAIVGLAFAAIYFSKKIPRYPGHNELIGFARTWTFLFDKLHFVLGILPARIAIFILDPVNRFLRITMIVIGAIPVICSEGLRFMQVNKLRVQLALSVISSVILAYWLVFFIR
jgi:NADH-quinone oxidoreductase subunit L